MCVVCSDSVRSRGCRPGADPCAALQVHVDLAPGETKYVHFLLGQAASRREALEVLRPGVAFYAGFFPRYNRLLAESGFPEAVRAIKAAWDRGDRDAATRAVPDELIDAVAIAGTPDDCRERLAAYRRAGLRLPIISPRVGGGDPRRAAMDAIRACAP